jgi:hypothetical protein
VRFILRNIPDELAHFYEAVDDAISGENSVEKSENGAESSTGRQPENVGKINSSGLVQRQERKGSSTESTRSSTESKRKENISCSEKGNDVDSDVKNINDAQNANESDESDTNPKHAAKPPTLLSCDKTPNIDHNVNHDSDKDFNCVSVEEPKFVEQCSEHPPNDSASVAMRVASLRSAESVKNLRTLCSTKSNTAGAVDQRCSEEWGPQPSNYSKLVQNERGHPKYTLGYYY